MENEQILRMFSTRAVRTRARVSIKSSDPVISVAKCIQKEPPNSYIPDPSGNSENLAVYEFGTAEKILYQTSNKVDVVVARAGTCGIITGLSCGLKKHDRNIMLVGVGPLGSELVVPETLNQIEAEYKADGIGYDFVLCVRKQSAVDL